MNTDFHVQAYSSVSILFCKTNLFLEHYWVFLMFDKYYMWVLSKGYLVGASNVIVHSLLIISYVSRGWNSLNPVEMDFN